MTADSVFVLAALSALVAASEWLVRRTPLRHAGSALLVILLTAVVANLGLLPTGSTEAAPVPAYDWIFGTVAPLAIFWLLLGVDLRSVLRAGLPIIGLFLVGSFATVGGVVAAMALVRGPDTIGASAAALGGMFAGTYTGGSLNFNAVALAYGVMRDGPLFAGAVAVDNVVTTVWMVVTLALPRVMRRVWPAARFAPTPPALDADEAADALATAEGATVGPVDPDAERLGPADLGLALAIGLGAVWASDRAAEALAVAGVAVPSILILTTVALVLAQIPAVGRLRGPRALGMFAVYLFLAVVGAFCDVAALRGLGALGVTLLAFASVAVAVHGLVVFGVARVFRMDPDVAAVASQANVGGGTSALALARSLGRDDLVLPAVLIGSLGTALGTFLGFWTVALLS